MINDENLECEGNCVGCRVRFDVRGGVRELEEKTEEEEEEGGFAELEGEFEMITDRRISDGRRQEEHVKEFEQQRASGKSGETVKTVETIAICGADEVGSAVLV